MKRDFAEQPQTRTGLAISQLLEFIHAETLAGGEELPTETVLAEQLGISRVVLREAVCHLKALGIIVSRRGSGLRVGNPDWSQVMSETARHIGRFGAEGRRRLFNMRRTLELGGIADAVENSTPGHVRLLSGVRVKLEECARTPEVSVVELELAGIDFHEIMMQPANSPLLPIINDALRDAFRHLHPADFKLGSYSPERRQQIICEHRLIVEAFAAKSPEAAYFALRNHLGKAL